MFLHIVDLGTWLVLMLSGEGEDEQMRHGYFRFDPINDEAVTSKEETSPDIGDLNGVLVRRKSVGRLFWCN